MNNQVPASGTRQSGDSDGAGCQAVDSGNLTYYLDYYSIDLVLYFVSLKT